jgi:hypothetical protein
LKRPHNGLFTNISMLELSIANAVDIPAAIDAIAKHSARRNGSEDRTNTRGTFAFHAHDSLRVSAMSAVGVGIVRSNA